jgi:hypothetical protein
VRRRSCRRSHRSSGRRRRRRRQRLPQQLRRLGRNLESRRQGRPQGRTHRSVAVVPKRERRPKELLRRARGAARCRRRRWPIRSAAISSGQQGGSWSSPRVDLRGNVVGTRGRRWTFDRRSAKYWVLLGLPISGPTGRASPEQTGPPLTARVEATPLPELVRNRSQDEPAGVASVVVPSGRPRPRPPAPQPIPQQALQRRPQIRWPGRRTPDTSNPYLLVPGQVADWAGGSGQHGSASSVAGTVRPAVRASPACQSALRRRQTRRASWQ